MSEPYYEDESVTLHHGDCLDVLAEMPDESVDAIVTDPPYGLEFMGKEWDSFKTYAGGNPNMKPQGEAIAATDDGQWQPGRAYGGRTKNPRCTRCGKLKRGNGSCKCPDPRWDTRTSEPAFQFQMFNEAWAREALRVLKPGGHLLAFGGTRTWHRLAVAVEDAGFEMRDSIAWLYGSGFPKSLDVSKAIDKAAPRAGMFDAFAAHFKERRLALGLSQKDIAQHFPSKTGGLTGCVWNWENAANVPTPEQWTILSAMLEIPHEMWALLIERAEAERELLRTERRTNEASGIVNVGQGDRTLIERKVTAPATPLAQQWAGWGTAIKPAHEPVVHAVKPLDNRGMLSVIGSHLDRLESEWSPLANAVASPSAPTRHGSREAKTGSAPASAATRPEGVEVPRTATGKVAGSSDQTATSPSESTGATFSNTVTSWRACWVELCELTSTSTTATTSSTTTDLRTLSSCLSRITRDSTEPSTSGREPSPSLVEAADNLFAASVLSLRSTLALSATESATSETPPTSPAAGATFEPIVVARKPLVGTVAANVLAWGTGALNIAASRVGTDPIVVRGGGAAYDAEGNKTFLPSTPVNEARVGRFPANVLLDGDAAAELDGQSGPSQSRVGNPRGAASGQGWGMTATGAEYSDAGGASRFFPTFRYQAKAPTRERPTVVAGDGTKTAHPTVKPLALMRWLVRLVTPPGGTVLDPFAGSGTTIEAAIIEGLQVVGIEREADYLPLIEARIARNRITVEGLPAAVEALALFNVEEPA